MWKQVQFKYDAPDSKVCGGIAFYERNHNLKEVICGCCGCTFDPNEVEIIQVYGNWINLSDKIIGD